MGWAYSIKTHFCSISTLGGLACLEFTLTGRGRQAEAVSADYFTLINMISQITPVTPESHFVFGQDVTVWGSHVCIAAKSQSFCRKETVFLCVCCRLEHQMSQVNHIFATQSSTV